LHYYKIVLQCCTFLCYSLSVENLQFPTEGSGALEPRPIDDVEGVERMQIFHIADFVRTKWGQAVRRPDPVDDAPAPTTPPPKAIASRPALQLHVPDFDPFDPDDEWLTNARPTEPVVLKLYEPPAEAFEEPEQGNSPEVASDARETDEDFFDRFS
jgi:hypothetical protein